MKKTADNIIELIGNTPLVKISNYMQNKGANVFAKLEMFNPMGSVKDRPAYNMIKTAERQGKLNKDTIIIEPTSGNTGIGLAYIAAVLGYKIILTMPETMSQERRKLLHALGAELILTEGAKGMTGAISKAKELLLEYPNSFMPQQFENPANPEAHYKGTAEEILRDMDGDVDILVCGVGTGGTLSGTGRRLKEHNANIKIIAVEPAGSAVISGQSAGPHKIQGIGAGFIPKNLDVSLIDEIIRVTDDEAKKSTRLLARTEGMIVGISSGAAAFAAKQIAQRAENLKKNIVVIFPDTGERYLSSDLFDD